MMNRPSKPSLGLAAAFTPAVLGSFLLAYALPRGMGAHYSVAIGMGAVVGITTLGVGRTRAWGAAAGAALVAAVGVWIGLLLDVRLNSLTYVAREFAETYGLDMATAEAQAEGILIGSSFMDLAKERFLRYDTLIMSFLAALGAFLAMRSRLTARLLRVQPMQNKDAFDDEI
ncbi:MAG: hypothetical protein OXT69_11580 [Candidatus Poribacteria bacterium]|nr:hypothetical protein [Candidatus Poribacteria bacterium]